MPLMTEPASIEVCLWAYVYFLFVSTFSYVSTRTRRWFYQLVCLLRSCWVAEGAPPDGSRASFAGWSASKGSSPLACAGDKDLFVVSLYCKDWAQALTPPPHSPLLPLTGCSKPTVFPLFFSSQSHWGEPGPPHEPAEYSKFPPWQTSPPHFLCHQPVRTFHLFAEMIQNIFFSYISGFNNFKPGCKMLFWYCLTKTTTALVCLIK